MSAGEPYAVELYVFGHIELSEVPPSGRWYSCRYEDAELMGAAEVLSERLEPPA